ncbi:hypothetical protein [Acinetobacter gerneri]|jgi:hypothetical protein|uniref:Uncharacterized protein n=1 Tax=Acinetobacter gerneri DSM 14967 = CIP 107464 = MTCC 9824 TaxID=1120926 RepID=N8ZPA0_9GAMM|nr:hypothetical protein [Acinetobacter gerneri]ENV33558.1 hypothetical protein F960_02270 [Acinetobacter gerneri DSM 14967 = CIP 107464 = MTCC 9824]EPR80900.1 hypothetical protein L289_4075 [Acinetobacter gerneri DSM 14967 = CIP 107464 = MTCC 9824]MCH4244550.1 hypothetical protein [Acinetobacter gerneri]
MIKKLEQKSCQKDRLGDDFVCISKSELKMLYQKIKEYEDLIQGYRKSLQEQQSQVLKNNLRLR